MSDRQTPGRDMLAARLLATFAAELDDSHRALVSDTLALERDPADHERQRSVFRIMHTLKGAARAAGVPPIETLCHSMEGELARTKTSGAPIDASQLTLLLAIADAFADAAQLLKRGEEVTEDSVAALIHRMSRSGRAIAPTPAVQPSESEAPQSDLPKEEEESATEPGANSQPVRDADSDDVRIGVGSLEGLLAAAGELLRLTSRMEDQPAALLGAVREIEDPALRIRLTRMTRRYDNDVRELHTHSSRLIESVRRFRQRPFSEIVEALPRAVRDVAVSVGKQAQLIVEGGEVEADRPVLELLREPLLHLVRNAVDHGLESPAERAVRRKPPEGTVRVRAALRGDRLRIAVSDDGNGLNLPELRRRLESRGLPVPPDKRGLADSIFDEGFSTRDEVTEISGRGVGLGIVRSAMEAVGGTVHVTWKEGAGTTFTMEVPVTVAVLRALIADVGGYPIAIPTTYVERVGRVGADEIRLVDGVTVLPDDEMPIPLVSLAARLGPPFAPDPSPDGKVLAVRLESGPRKLAAVVRDILDERELVLRPLELAATGRRSLVAGAALLPDGNVALVLDVTALLATSGDSATRGSVSFASERAITLRRILVVDDSITTRTLEESVLSASGYDVHTAVDGAQAWEMLQNGHWDLVVSDIEMPRLNGIELCRQIREFSRTGSLPVVLVTSLDKPEEKLRGLDAGADAYITKSSFDQDTLLETIRQLIGRGERETA